jgi:uncharacterized protein
MKYLLLVLVLVIAYGIWRSARAREERAENAPPPQPTALPQEEMVRCTVCALHLPRPDALPGDSGRFYCSQEHRRSGGN